MKPIQHLLFALLLLLCCTTCRNNSEGSEADTATSGRQSDQTSSITSAIPIFEKLDQLSFSNMNKKTIRQSEEGDCENTVYRFSKDNWSVVLDSISCGEYYRQRTYYQLTGAGDITMVHFQYLEPFVDPESGSVFYALEEKIMDFNGAEPVMMSRVDTLPKASSEYQGGFDLFFRSDARMIQTKGAVEELDKAYWQKEYSILVN